MLLNTLFVTITSPKLKQRNGALPIVHYPGEIIGSGTVGTGCGLELGRYLNSGDVVELEIEKIGILRNRFLRDHVSEILSVRAPC